MRCGECETENVTGAEFCTHCGKVLAVSLGAADGDQPSELDFSLADPFATPAGLSRGATMDQVPGPDSSPGPEPAFDLAGDAPRSVFGDQGVCGLCSVACSSSTLASVNGGMFCPECAPLVEAGGPAESPRGSGGPAYSPPPSAPPAKAEGMGLGVAPAGPAPQADLAYQPAYEPAGSREGTPAAPLGASAFDRPVRPSGRPIYPVRRERSLGLPVVLILLVLGIGGYLFWSLTMGRDRIDRLLAEADASDRSVRLMPTYEKGQSWRYRGDLTMNLDSSGSVMGQSASGSVEFKADAEFFLDVLSVDASGTAELQLTLEDIHLDLRSEGESLGELTSAIQPAMLEQLKGESITFRVDRQGRYVGSPDEDGPGLSMFAEMLGGTDESWPDRELKPGDEWEQSFGGPGGAGGFGPDMDAKVTCTHEGYAKHLGRDCAVIRIEGGMSESEAGAKVTLDLKGAMFVDTAIGQIVHLALDGTFELAASGSMMNLNLDCELSMDLKLQ